MARIRYARRDKNRNIQGNFRGQNFTKIVTYTRHALYKNYRFAKQAFGFSQDSSKLITDLGTQQAALVGQQNLVREKLTEMQQDVQNKANTDDVDKINGEVSNKGIELDSMADTIKNVESTLKIGCMRYTVEEIK